MTGDGRLQNIANGSQLAGDGILVVLIGLSGSGKSTIAEAMWEPFEVLSMDELRGWVSGDPCDQFATDAAVRVMQVILRERLSRRLTTVIDATNTSARVRAHLLETAARAGVPAVAVVVDTPFEECVARNDLRQGPPPGRKFGRRVPYRVITRQRDEMLAGLPGLRDEGFADVINHRGEQL
jgi:predicted kinase